jgi:hypothetical protein
MANRLWWGTYSSRMGWWITKETGGIVAVWGPCICVSAGGGPKEALKEAQSMGFENLEVEPPYPHDDVHGKPCIACYASDNSGEGNAKV